MKFPVNKCMSCGLDLTTVEPAEVKYVGNPGEEAEVGTCPQCSAPYFMVEDTAPPLDAPEALEPEPVAEVAPEPEPEPAVEPEPEPPVVRGRRRASEPEPEE
ncbi:unnamed protein product [marine sediment metagenome]|uniref:Uncharacterized protein n=1 Tax=marine sediment metagenome TaxID=412755 RepID=X1KLP9_9ZZZZ